MTMPHERFRSIVRMAEMLAAAPADSQLDPLMRKRADELLHRYPDEQTLLTLIQSKRQGLPQDLATSLDDAITWMRDLGATDSLSADLIEWRRWILRHFPKPWEVDHQLKAADHSPSALWSSVDQWIHPEGR